jgi:hypothetical protein
LSSVAASWASGAIGRKAATHPVPGEFVDSDTRRRDTVGFASLLVVKIVLNEWVLPPRGRYAAPAGQ